MNWEVELDALPPQRSHRLEDRRRNTPAFPRDERSVNVKKYRLNHDFLPRWQHRRFFVVFREKPTSFLLYRMRRSLSSATAAPLSSPLQRRCMTLDVHFAAHAAFRMLNEEIHGH